MAHRILLSHPGEILLREFMEPLQITQYRLAKSLGVSARRINEIVHGKRAITPDTSLRLAKYFCMSDRFFMHLQMDYDMRLAKRALDKELSQSITPFPRTDLQTPDLRAQ
jgi:addiction module HigA family antidote